MKTIIKKPVVSEKSVALSEVGKYVFIAPERETKGSVASAVEAMFKVKVTKVHSVKNPGKPKTFRRLKGTTAARRKFIVTLKKGDKIDLFEGAK